MAIRRVEAWADGKEGCYTDDTGSATAFPVIHHEAHWRTPCRAARPAEPVTASRWRSPPIAGLHAATPADSYVIAVFLRATRGTFRVDGTPWRVGTFAAGATVVTAPSQVVAAEFFDPVDSLHLHVDARYIENEASWARDIANQPLRAGIYHDDAIEKLARALLAAHDTGCMARCAESLGKPIVARLRHLGAEMIARPASGRRGVLPTWRLVRVTHFVDANLGQHIKLADIARAAGLSPMHFAARFRAATGHKPHEYLQLCRIERAKHLLAEGNRSLIDIAMEVGFRTQAHFTTVFKRLAGRTPNAWRTHLRDPLL